jgi:hypothetical protein
MSGQLQLTAVTTTLPLLIEKLLWSLNAFAHDEFVI